jgi:hypothetical protein
MAPVIEPTAPPMLKVINKTISSRDKRRQGFEAQFSSAARAWAIRSWKRVCWYLDSGGVAITAERASARAKMEGRDAAGGDPHHPAHALPSPVYTISGVYEAF